ncbi:MAG: Hsp70 family protein, partial [Chloroflexi bacterium]|nr:Hsp70 family protein [Chloroflexota bacterium]
MKLEMHIGIDFGTTNTTAALFNGRDLQFIPLDPANKDSYLLRSMIYMTRQQETILGINAVQTYLHDNTGRIARLEEKVVGTIENTVSRISRHPTEPDGPIVIVYDVTIEEDVGAPGRLLQSIKTGLRDPDYTGTSIYDRYYTLPELIGILLRHVREKAEQQLGTAVTAVTLGRPVKFSSTAETDSFAETRLREAAQLAGFEQIQFEKEPVAAALFYTQHIYSPQTLLVFDFGGGTLDLTVMRVNERANGHADTHILATQGVLVGGDDLDSAIMRGRVGQYFGAASSIDQQGHPFPAHLSGRLDRWQTIPELSKTENISIIRKARVNGNNAAAFAALECLARKNYGFPLFEEIERTKRQLTNQEEAYLQMQQEEIDLAVSLTRREFQAMIVAEIAAVQLGVDETLRKASLTADQIDVVVTTGGSSLIPVFQNILQRRFAAAELVHSDTFGSVAAGLALRAAQTS